MTTMSEALAGCLVGQADVPDDMFELVAGLAVDEGCSAVSELLLKHKELPFVLAEKLVARRGVSAVELAAFAAREDIPPETLLEWVRKERRVTVLAQIAEKTDLPREVFETLATRKGTKLRNALLFNESVPVEVRADIAADLLNTASSQASLHQVLLAIKQDGTLQHAVFTLLNPDVFQRYAVAIAEWDSLDVSQLHSLMSAVERHAAAIPPLPVKPMRVRIEVGSIGGDGSQTLAPPVVVAFQLSASPPMPAR